MFVLFFMIVPVLLVPKDARGEGEVELQSMQSDIYACMQQEPAGIEARVAFSKKYNVPLSKVDEIIAKGPVLPPSSNGSWDNITSQIVCGLEMLTGIGFSVWVARVSMDGFVCIPKGLHTADYCINYSEHCDHYNWQKGCLEANVHWRRCFKHRWHKQR